MKVYLGTIIKLNEEVEKENHEVIVAIPGVADEVLAYPFSNSIDEPKISDPVIVYELDEIFKSYYAYQKIKEHNFIGFRSSGKMIDITPSAITIGVFDPTLEYKDNERPECTTIIKIDNENNITINSDSEISVSSTGDCSVEGNNVNVSAKTTCTVDAPKVELKGTQLIGNNGMVTPSNKGPFCSIPVCPLTNAPHLGNISIGK